MRAPQVGGRVHQPGNIQCENVSEDGADEKCVFKRLSPVVPGDEGGHREAQHEDQRHVVPLIEIQIII
jgi:hypothetical protein